MSLTKNDIKGLLAEHQKDLVHELDTHITAQEKRLRSEIKGIEKHRDKQIGRLGAKIDAVEKRLGKHLEDAETRLDKKIDGLDQKIDGVEKRLDQKISRLDAKVDAVEHRLNERIDAVEKRLEKKIASERKVLQIFIDQQLRMTNGLIEDIAQQLKLTHHALTHLLDKQADLETRVDKLEQQAAPPL